MTFPKRIHCVGIGGVGLSALAQLLQHEGHILSGSDRSESPVTEMLAGKGIAVHIGHSASNISSDVELVIYSAAVPLDNPERTEAQARGLSEMSYPEALGKVSETKQTIAISGTHGKTTTTAMIAKMLVDIGRSPTAIIGSLTKDFESNFVPGESNLFVVEACEYRRHFLNISPFVLVITNIEFDHTDYFKDLNDFISAFNAMAKRVPKEGIIVADLSEASVAKALAGVSAPVVDYRAETSPELNLIGEFNKMNARSAKAAVKAVAADVDEMALDVSLRGFSGTWRRFEYKGKTAKGALVYDDYAHHPTAIKGTIAAAREKFPDKLITVVFQPHLYSRTKSLLHDFAESLATASDVVLLPIYAAREQLDPEISSELLASEIVKISPGLEVRVFQDFSLAKNLLLQLCKDDTVIITMGASDIYKLAEELVA